MNKQNDLFDQNNIRFDGADYVPERDNKRLTSQINNIFNLMKDGKWRSLNKIAVITGYPEASISAQLRHLRKTRFGSHIVKRRHVKNGLNQYSLIVNKNHG